MGRPFVQSGPQRLLALAFQELFDLLDVGQESGLVVLGRPQGDMFRCDRLHVGAAELGDLGDLFEHAVALCVAALQPLAGHDRRGLIRLAALGLRTGSGGLLDGVDLLRREPQPAELFLDARRDGKADSLLRRLFHDLVQRHALVPQAGDVAHGERLLVAAGRKTRVQDDGCQKDRPRRIVKHEHRMTSI